MREQCERLSQGPSTTRNSCPAMIVGMNDDVGRSLSVEDHNLLRTLPYVSVLVCEDAAMATIQS
jgi:hypothetical protein